METIKDEFKFVAKDFVVDSVTATLAMGADPLTSKLIGTGTKIAVNALWDFMKKAYEDYSNRQISNIQKNNADIVMQYANETFMNLSNEKSPSNSHVESYSYMEAAFDFSIHMLMKAVNESQRKKLPIMGRFWGYAAAQDNNNWDDMVNKANILSSLSYRQTVLIIILKEGFNGEEKSKMAISNPSVCIELHQMLQLGLWKINGARFTTDNSAPIPIEDIETTIFCDEIYNIMMLKEISNVEISEVKKQLNLIRKPNVSYLKNEDDLKPKWEVIEDEDGVGVRVV